MKNTKYNLQEADVNQLNSYDERYIRWQGRSIDLLSFSINLLFTISLFILGSVIDNLDSNLFKKNIYFDSYTLGKIIIIAICLSAVLGLLALLSRLLDFKYTAQIVRKRTHLFKKRKGIKCNDLKSEQQITEEINNLKCLTKNLGITTWFIFKLQFLVFFITLILLAFNA